MTLPQLAALLKSITPNPDVSSLPSPDIRRLTSIICMCLRILHLPNSKLY
ncbi:hypothetical protein [Neisseria iguanae]|nr:hypothetical protein [Neisseria iguanae]